MAGGEHQREPAADAIADHLDPARAPVYAGQPGTHRLDVVERPPSPGTQIPADRPQAGQLPAPEEQVRRDGQVSFARQPVSLVAQS